MGYLSVVEGGLTFSRPLAWKEFRHLGKIRHDGFELDAHDELDLDVVTARESTDDGYREVITAEGVVPRWEEPYKAYDLVNQVRSLVNQLPADVHLSGYFEIKGDESGDIRRLYVRSDPLSGPVESREVIEVHPSLRWPLSRYGLGDDEITEGRP